MKPHYLLLISITLCCNNKKPSTENLYNPILIKKSNAVLYNNYPLSIANCKKIRETITDTSFKNLKTVFTSIITDTLVPYWLGTKWNFYGTSEKPNQGTIACGYFVATILRDAGVKINRIKMAQASSEDFIKKLIMPPNIQQFRNMEYHLFENKIKQNGFALYVIGLDYHIGFLLYDASGIWFIHSSYYDKKEVVKETANQCSVLYYSKYRIAGKLTNKDFLNGWLHSSTKVH